MAGVEAGAALDVLGAAAGVAELAGGAVDGAAASGLAAGVGAAAGDGAGAELLHPPKNIVVDKTKPATTDKNPERIMSLSF
jgi:hypothetical protein